MKFLHSVPRLFFPHFDRSLSTAKQGHGNSQVGDASAELVMERHFRVMDSCHGFLSLKRRKPDSRLESGARRKLEVPV